jgi:hypothetical protein
LVRVVTTLLDNVLLLLLLLLLPSLGSSQNDLIDTHALTHVRCLQRIHRNAMHHRSKVSLQRRYCAQQTMC